MTVCPAKVYQNHLCHPTSLPAQLFCWHPCGLPGLAHVWLSQSALCFTVKHLKLSLQDMVRSRAFSKPMVWMGSHQRKEGRIYSCKWVLLHTPHPQGQAVSPAPSVTSKSEGKLNSAVYKLSEGRPSSLIPQNSQILEGP